MKRNQQEFLQEWKQKPNRKPLVLRGARQVGKSYLVRTFGQSEFKNTVEINFEHEPDIADLIIGQAPERALRLLEAKFGVEVTPGKTLLFLDEIQARGDLLVALRYLYEKAPDLHVIAAGSLLDFVLNEPDFSMPVGRIEYCFLGPMTFEEFLLGIGEEGLAEFVATFSLNESIPSAIHRRLLELTKAYWIVGGMPEAVHIFSKSGSFHSVEQTKQSILLTYRDDFNKYRQRADVACLRKVFDRIPLLVGSKLKYVNIDREIKSTKLAEAVKLLSMARVLTKVPHASGNGIPLGAESDEKVYKTLFLDTGLMSSACGLRAADIESAEDITLINRGALAEQFIGQHLLYAGDVYVPPQLFCWIREKRNSEAEVDYLLPVGRKIVPVEVKAGKSGTLKSLHVFLEEKKSDVGVRFNADFPSLLKTDAPGFRGGRIDYSLLSLPHYLVGQVGRIVGELLK